MELSGACAFITGGSGGLGSVIAVALAKEGVDIAIGYRNGLARAERVKAAAEKTGQKAVLIKIDQSDPDSIEQAILKVSENFAGCDLLVNNAGMAAGGHSLPYGDLAAMTPEIWDEMMTVNVRGPYLVSRAAAPFLRKSKWGRIVNLGSTIGIGPWGAGAPYAPSKGAIGPLTRYLAAALAPEVTVNCVAPGLMEDTMMSSGAPESFVEGWRTRAVLEKTTSLEDVASHVVAFCKSETVTGQVLVADGGIHFN
ncbi:SDR family NAD(P)-dependent oxidoreductase [Sneathiella sp.]|jgi:3-oxoacyl-[acyl-carrier protein] reductase|uniref:SDR family NAD(P)-dependent oxidoreductase n=1 Tax=Sneathiella sp. TaxID=1964365 RepID=UPI0039E363FA